MKLPVFKAFGASFALVFGHYGEILKILWLPLVALMGLAVWLMQHMLVFSNRMLALSANGARPDPHAVLQQVVPMMSWAGLAFLAEIIFVPMMFAGILRFIIRGERAKGIFYLHYGADELRILITFILQSLLVGALYVGGAILLGLLVGGLHAVSLSAAEIGGAAGGIVFTIFMIWVALRLSLTLPAAVGARKIGIGPSWSATKGNVWRLLGYWILWGLVIGIVECLLITFLMPGYFEHLATLMQVIGSHPGDHEAVQQAMLQWQQGFMTSFAGRLPLIMGVGFVFALVIYPLFIASGGVAYRLMTEKKDEEGQPAL